MVASRRRFSREFKVAALSRVDAGLSVAEVARFCRIDPNLLHRWRRDFRRSQEDAFPGAGRRKGDQSRIAELETQLGRQALEIAFLRQCLQSSPLIMDAASVQ
jgi:transposase